MDSVKKELEQMRKEVVLKKVRRCEEDGGRDSKGWRIDERHLTGSKKIICGNCCH